MTLHGRAIRAATIQSSRDGDVYRMYYRGSDLDATHEVTCYAESSDGVRWEKPELGLFDFKGSKKNNIVWADLHGSHNLMPFKDMNPAAADSERYKAVAGTKDYGFYGFSSPDGLRWKRVQPEPFFPDDRSTDWISSGFWDRDRGQYLAYHRAWDSDHGEVMDLRVPIPGEQPRPDGRMNVAGRWRSVRYSSSADFVHWTDTRLCQFDPPPIAGRAALHQRRPALLPGTPHLHRHAQEVRSLPPQGPRA